MIEFIAEDLLAKRLGMSREAVRALRPKKTRAKGNNIEWPLDEAHRLAMLLNLELPNEGAGEPAGEVLTVTSDAGRDGWHFANHNLIKARRQDGEEVIVRVVDSKKYAPLLKGGQPMVVRAKKSEMGNWWMLLGREPRWKGMW